MLSEDSSFVGCNEESKIKDDDVDPKSEEEITQKDLKKCNKYKTPVYSIYNSKLY